MVEQQSERMGKRLAESVLDAAGSLFQLQEELDRISIHHDRLTGIGTPPSGRAGSSKKHGSRSEKKRERKRTPGVCGVVNDQGKKVAHDGLSLGSSESCEQSFSGVSSTSRYDSAIGSLHSQTDNDSLSSRLSISATATERRPPAYKLPSPLTFGAGIKSGSVRNIPVGEATVEQYFSPQPLTPTFIIVGDAQTNDQEAFIGASRDGSDSQQDQVTVLGTRVQLRRKKSRQKEHNPLTAEDAKKHFQWLESSGRNVNSANEKLDPDPAEKSGTELESEGSHSTVVAEEEVWGGMVGDEIFHKRPQCESIEFSQSLSEYLPQKEGVSEQIPIQGSYPPSKHVNMPQRYNTGLSPVRQGQRRLPQRAPSILQRLKRRRGSFRQETSPRPRRMPVQRSLSDRFVYHLKRKWETSTQEDPYAISTPSQLRPIGRLLRTYTGRLHIIQLHKPPDGHYGIYITQRAGRKIFISRFATPTAEKFYAGLLSPGDELVSINKLKIRGKSLDYVYSVLSQLDSVVIGVVPVTAHRNW